MASLVARTEFGTMTIETRREAGDRWITKVWQEDDNTLVVDHLANDERAAHKQHLEATNRAFEFWQGLSPAQRDGDLDTPDYN